jgi:hypothetical protein
MKQDPTPLEPPKMSPGAQSMKTGPDALRTAENVSGSAKHENESGRPRYRRTRIREPTPSEPPKTSPGAQNIKTGPDALGTAENNPEAQNMKTGAYALRTAKNNSRSAKHENGTRRPPQCRKRCPGEQNMKTGPDDLGTAENEFRRFRERKT